MTFSIGSKVGIVQPSLLNIISGGPFTIIEQVDFDKYRLDNGLEIIGGLLAPWSQKGQATTFPPLVSGRFSMGQLVRTGGLPRKIIYGPCSVYGINMYQLEGVPVIGEQAMHPCAL